MNVNRNKEGATKNICVIIIPTNSRQPEEQVTGNLTTKRMILIQLFLMAISTKAIQSMMIDITVNVFMADSVDSSSDLQCDVNSSEAVSIQTRTLSNDDQTQDTLNTTELELEEMLNDSLSEEEISNSSYELFIGEDNNASLDSVSDSEDPDNLDMTSGQCESKPDDVLYSGAPLTSSTSFVLLLTFVMKHKLTREAFNDLLLVIEAHCPRPNNCKTSVKKLLEFASQANEDLEKHYFCDYCKAYFGKGTGNCNICGQRNSKGGGFFIEVPVEKQLFCSLKAAM